MGKMLALPAPPEAYFVVNAYAHIGATNALKTAGASLAKKIVFASFDETAYALLLGFCRYSIAQPEAEIGIAAARLILDRIEGRQRPFPESMRLATRVMRHAV